MRSRIGTSTVAGLVAGVVFGVMMNMMTAPTPAGGQMPVIAMVGQIVGSPTVAVGWLYHLFNSAVIGAIFGWLVAPRVRGYSSGVGWGTAYGFGWWILGGLILMPVMLGMPPFAPLMMAEMQIVAAGSLIGHLIYGLILGSLYVAMYRGVRVPVA
jgi:xanthosine utilization system XapX-like protein